MFLDETDLTVLLSWSLESSLVYVQVNFKVWARENIWYLRFCIWHILLNTFHFPCSLLQMAECYFLMAGFPFIRLILVYMSVNSCVCPQRPAEGVTPMPLKSQANVRGRMWVSEITGPRRTASVVNCQAHVWIFFHGAYIPHFFSFPYWST